MNYKRLYNSIVTTAQLQERECYTETHHIVPSSMGGSNDVSNLVRLTPREHFICHWLLTKFTTGINKRKMIKALSFMRSESTYQKRYTTKITARVYENLRKEHARIISEQNSGENNGAKQPEARVKISMSKLGQKRPAFSKEWRENLSKAHSGEGNGMYGKTHSADTRQKIGDKIRGTKHSAELIERRISKIRGSKRQKRLCPHCDREVAVNGYARWHGDNCKNA